ncbi:hypothetical protein quinque_012060 [Culex quinquefasciatus]
MGRKLAMAEGGWTAIDRGSNDIYLDVHKSTQAPPACVRISRSDPQPPLLGSFVPSSHRPDHRRYPRRAFAMISCAPSGD